MSDAALEETEVAEVSEVEGAREFQDCLDIDGNRGWVTFGRLQDGRITVEASLFINPRVGALNEVINGTISSEDYFRLRDLIDGDTKSARVKGLLLAVLEI